MKTFKWTFPEPSHPEQNMPGSRLKNWHCPKCHHLSCEVGEFHAAGSTIAKFLDVQTEKFCTVTCSQCAYTEIYKCSREKLNNVLDFLIG